jgi:hypothetical protein
MNHAPALARPRYLTADGSVMDFGTPKIERDVELPVILTQCQ